MSIASFLLKFLRKAKTWGNIPEMHLPELGAKFKPNIEINIVDFRVLWIPNIEIIPIIEIGIWFATSSKIARSQSQRRYAEFPSKISIACPCNSVWKRTRWFRLSHSGMQIVLIPSHETITNNVKHTSKLFLNIISNFDKSDKAPTTNYMYMYFLFFKVRYCKISNKK